ncbi:MAG TPA: hypothetical protein VGQ50_06545 [Actinomycetota bacterium]|jgi:hypothetical protein|nr:hypothetical protein [Actinomycetota bacterium]
MKRPQFLFGLAYAKALVPVIAAPTSIWVLKRPQPTSLMLSE